MGDAQSNFRDDPPGICVVGAGVSGLRAAGLLATAGLKVTVLEARNRIGGRVQQSSELGLPIDVGASWIHGTQGNPLLPLAEKTRTTTVACGDVDSICDINGDWIQRDMARNHYSKVWEILEMAMEKSRDQYPSLSSSEKMMDLFRQEVERRKVREQQSEDHELLLLRIVEMWGAFMGDDCENQSLKSLWLEAGIDGGMFNRR
jgi:monoamine oxidase